MLSPYFASLGTQQLNWTKKTQALTLHVVALELHWETANEKKFGIDYVERRQALIWQIYTHRLKVKFWWQLLVDINGPCDVLHHTQSSSCCEQSWMWSVVNRRRSSVNCWQHLVTT